MMYVEFMKNFLLADSRKLLGVILILESWAQKRLIPMSRMSRNENVFLAQETEMSLTAISSLESARKTFDSYF